MNGLLAYPVRNLLGGVAYMLVVMAVATVAYVVEGWSLGDAIYMVVLTVYTVGYEEVHPLDTSSLRAITIALIVLGCTGMLFLTGALIQLVTVSQLQQVFGLKRMQNQIGQLADHVIVCGFGRIGLMLARDLHAGKVAFVVVERDETRFARARELGYLCLQGDATDESFLAAAGIARARLIATVLPDDAANVFITLSARSLNRKLTIIARGEAPSTEGKLLQAGADQVVLPTHIGAERIAEIILYPAAAQQIQSFDKNEGFLRSLHVLGLEVEVFPVEEGSPCAGLTVSAIEQESRGAFLVVALNRRGERHLSRPAPDDVVHPGDGIVLVQRFGRAGDVVAFFQNEQRSRSSNGTVTANAHRPR